MKLLLNIFFNILVIVVFPEPESPVIAIVLNKDNTFSTATIAEDELVKYEHVNFLDIEDDELKERLVEEAHLQSISNPAWPIAKLIEW